MRVAIVTFEGFNEIDSFVAMTILNRVRDARAEIVCPAPYVESGNGLRVAAQQPLEFANQADAVLFGSGRLTAKMVADPTIMTRFALDPRRQLVGCQCSGALALAKLGLIDQQPVCTDLLTRPHLEAAGLRVLDRSFFAAGNVASAGGCLSSALLAAWVLWRLAGRAAAEQALASVAPIGELEAWVAAALGAVEPFVAPGAILPTWT